MAPLVGQHRLTVLLANDQEDWHQTVRGLLEPQGVQTISARSGREALQVLESRPVHLAVLDHQMPQLGGLQVIRLFRELNKGTPPAILLAHDLTSHLLREALGMHVFSVLSKPVDTNLLLDAMARVLRRYYESRWPIEAGDEARDHTGTWRRGGDKETRRQGDVKPRTTTDNGPLTTDN